jgi:hypothetical protein
MNRPKWLRHLFLRLAGYNPVSVLDVSTEEGYVIASAIRGPDDYTVLDPFKWVLTARIRHWKGISKRTGCDVRETRMDMFDIQAIGQRMENLVPIWTESPQLKRAANHYFSHAQSALMYLEVPEEDCDERQMLETFARAVSWMSGVNSLDDSVIEHARRKFENLKNFYFLRGYNED